MVATGGNARVWGVVAAAGIAVVLLGGAAGGPPSHGASGAPTSAPAQQTPAQNGQPSPSAALLSAAERVASALEAKNTYEQSQKGQQDTHDAAQAARDAAFWAMLMFFAAVAETVVTLVGVILVGFTLREAKRTADETKRSADEMKKSADAAAKAAETGEKALLDLERPYIFIHGVWGVAALPQNQYRPEISYSISNNGKLAARIDNISIRCGPELHGQFPPLKVQGNHWLLSRPVMSPDKEHLNVAYDVLNERFAQRTDVNQPGQVTYEVDDGTIFGIVITYRSPPGKVLETAYTCRFQQGSGGSPGGWVEVEDSRYTYMK